MTLFELSVSEGDESSPSLMVSEVSSIPIYMAEEESVDEEEEGRIKFGFQQRNGK